MNFWPAKNESIHLNSWHHSHKKQKDSLETQVYFGLNLKYLGWPYREYIKTAKNGSFCEELLSGEKTFEAVLANFCCYDYGANASEAVQKIGTRTKATDGVKPQVTLKQLILYYTYEKNI